MTNEVLVHLQNATNFPITVYTSSMDAKSVWQIIADIFFQHILGPATTIVAAILAAKYAFRSSMFDKRHEYAAEILKHRLHQLEKFYAPMRVLVEQSRLLYEKLIFLKTQKNSQFDRESFRLLDTINKDIGDPHLKPTIKSILEIGKEMSGIIRKNASLIEPIHKDVFIQYLAHLDMLIDSSETGSINVSTQDGWQKFGYYPRLLNREVAEGFKFVHSQISTYVRAGDRIIAGLLGNDPALTEQALELTSNRLETVRFYEDNAKMLEPRYSRIDLSRFTTILTSKLSPTLGTSEGRHLVMDLGCGTGRDTLWFLSNNCNVSAIDSSPAMLRITRLGAKKLGLSPYLETREATFDEIDYDNRFDAVWASASLVHLSEDELINELPRIVRSLKVGGILFVSLKYGEHFEDYDGRRFFLHNKCSIARIRREIQNIKVQDSDIFITDDKVSDVSEESATALPGKHWISFYATRTK